MSESAQIINDFVKTIKKFFPPGQIKHLDSRYATSKNAVTDISAVVIVRGDNVGVYDGTALLEEIDGMVVDAIDTMVVVQGTFQGRNCRVGIACSGTAA